MKFACPSCSAKYKIADEKIPERGVVRMKCRKCGHHIEITSSQTDGEHVRVRARHQASILPPADLKAPTPAPTEVKSKVEKPLVAEPAATKSAAAKPTPSVAPERASALPPRPGGVPRPKSRITGTGPTRSLPKPSVPPPAPRTASVPPPASAKPAASGLARVSATESTDLPRPSLPAPSVPAPPVTRHGGAFAPSGMDRPSMGTGALANMFDSAVETGLGEVAVPQPELPKPITNQEWFVGFGGKPRGPYGLEEIRAQARAGQIDQDSLVWKEGFEAWRPLSSFPELLGALDAPHLMTVPPPRSLSALPAAPSGPVIKEAEPSVMESLHPEALVHRKPGSRFPVAAWFAVIVAFVFGMTVFYVFIPPQTKEVIKVVNVPQEAPDDAKAEPAKPDLQAADPTEGARGAAAEESQDTAAPTAAVTKRATASGTTAPAKRATKPEDTSKEEPKRKGLLSGVDLAEAASGPGPATGSTGPATQAQSLDSAAISSTVRRYTPSVRRSCWQPALNARAANAPATARVVVTINVAPSGGVTGVQTSGDPKGYLGLSRCIAGKVRSWQFPKAGGPTTAQVPFVFASQ